MTIMIAVYHYIN